MIYSLGERRVEFRGEYFVADNAAVIGSVIVGDRASVWYNAVVRADNDIISIGDDTNIQDGSVLHTDEGVPLTLGNRVTVGHLAMLHGCTVGENSLIGIKSVILNKTVIGKNCIIGANTLLAEGKTIPDGSLVLGSPGRIVRKLSEEQIAGLAEFSEHYAEKIAVYNRDLRVQDRLAGG